MKKVAQYKQKNKLKFFTCSYISLVLYKVYESLKKISFKCSNLAEDITYVEKELEVKKIKQKVEVAEKIIEHKEEIIQHYNSLYATIDDCEKDNDFLARSLIKSYLLFKEKKFDELDKFYKEIDMEYYIN